MRRKAIQTYDKFMGVVTSIDPTLLPDGAAQAASNVRCEDGILRYRYGWGSLSTGWAGVAQGAVPIEGYDDANLNRRELVVPMANAGAVRMYTVAADGTKGEIRPGGSALALTPGDWTGLALDGYGYLCGPDGVYKHEIGDGGSWVALDADRPAQPSSLPVIDYRGTVDRFVHNWGAGAITNAPGPSTLLPSSTTGTGEVTSRTLENPFGDGTYYAGAYDYVLPLAAAWDVKDIESFTIRFSNVASVPDPTRPGHNADVAAIHPTTGYGLTLPRMRVEFVRDGGSYTALDAAVTNVRSVGVKEWDVVITWPVGVTKSLFTDVVAIRFKHLLYHLDYLGVVQTHPAAKITWTIGTIGYVPSNAVTTGDLSTFRVAVGAYDSVRDAESKDLAVLSTANYVHGLAFYDHAANAIGTVLRVTPSVSAGDTVTHNRIYVQFEDDAVWRLAGQVKNDGTSYLDLTASEAALRELPERVAGDVEKLGSPATGCAHQGFVCWLYGRGKQNLRLSGVGNPGRLYRAATDRDTDALRGADFSLSDNFADEPRFALSVQDTLVVFGRDAVYYMVGTTPYGMSPPKRVGNAVGILGRAACTWVTRDGVPCVVWVGSDQAVYTVDQRAVGSGDYSRAVGEITLLARGLVRSWLTQTDTPDPLKLGIGVDFRSDSLWLVYDDRALVLRRPSLLDGERHWEPYEYNHPGFARFIPTRRDGLRGIRADGSQDELEYQSGAGFAVRTPSATSDGGSQPPDGFWKSGRMDGTDRQAFRVRVDRPSIARSIGVVVTSEQGAAAPISFPVTLAAGVEFARLPYGAVGQSFEVEVLVLPGDVVRKVEMEIHPRSRQAVQ